MTSVLAFLGEKRICTIASLRGRPAICRANGASFFTDVLIQCDFAVCERSVWRMRICRVSLPRRRCCRAEKRLGQDQVADRVGSTKERYSCVVMARVEEVVEEAGEASVGSAPNTEVLASPPFSKTGGSVDWAAGVVLGLDLRKDKRDRESLLDEAGVSSSFLRDQPNHDLCRVCCWNWGVIGRCRMEMPGEEGVR